MSKQLGRTGVVAGALALAAALGACGSDSALEFFPQIEVAIEGQPGRTSWEFEPDITGGQLSQQVTVRIRNSGKGDLVLNAVDFISENEFIKLAWPGGKPDFPLTLKDGEVRTLTVSFKGSPGVVDLGAAQLVIKHNDRDRPGDVKLIFSIKQQGATIEVNPKELSFTNPSKASPPEQCVIITNSGNAPLVFVKAYLGKTTPYYQITSTPNEGDTIAALGEPANPKTKPAELKVCVRVTPEDQDADYTATLVIETNDTKQPKVTIALKVIWEPDSKYIVTCVSASGQLNFDFSAVQAGVEERCCNIYNESKSGFLINKVEVLAATPEKTALAAQLFAPVLYKKNSAGDKEEVKPKYSISQSKGLDVCVAFTYPADGKVTNAELAVRFSVANQADSLVLPILAGACKVPDLVVGPAGAGLWLQASVGETAKRELVLANQSCAPLQVVQVCASKVSVGVGSASPCANLNALSTHFTIDPEVGLTSVPAWGSLPVKLAFSPADNKYTDINEFLHVTYCAGAWDGDKCDEPLTTLTLNLQGYTKGDLKLPKVTLAPTGDGGAMVGSPYKVAASVEAGDWPIGQYGAYLWFLAERPAGSMAWLNAEQQSSDAEWVTVKPDVPGAYRLVGAVQAVHPDNPAKFMWSEQVSHTFEVKAP